MLAPFAALLLAVPTALPHQPGESMEFDIVFHGIAMGAARISVGRPFDATLPVRLEVQTTGLARIVKVRDQLVTYLDTDTGLPRVFSLAAQEGGYRHASTTTFERVESRATVLEIGTKSRTTSVLEDAPPRTLDFVALVFALRTLPLEPGTRHPFDVIAGKKVSRVVAECVGRETIGGSGWSTPALKVRVPTSFTGEFQEKNPTHVWLTDDPRRVVVRIETDFAIGGIAARLVAYEPGEREGSR